MPTKSAASQPTGTVAWANEAKSLDQDDNDSPLLFPDRFGWACGLSSVATLSFVEAAAKANRPRLRFEPSRVRVGFALGTLGWATSWGLAPRDRALPARHRFTGEPPVGRVPDPASGARRKARKDGVLAPRARGFCFCLQCSLRCGPAAAAVWDRWLCAGWSRMDWGIFGLLFVEGFVFG